MEYTYTKTVAPNLDHLEADILASSIANTYIYLKWDDGEIDELDVVLTRELNTEEKTLLDNLVAQV